MWEEESRAGVDVGIAARQERFSEEMARGKDNVNSHLAIAGYNLTVFGILRVMELQLFHEMSPVFILFIHLTQLRPGGLNTSNGKIPRFQLSKSYGTIETICPRAFIVVLIELLKAAGAAQASIDYSKLILVDARLRNSQFHMEQADSWSSDEFVLLLEYALPIVLPGVDLSAAYWQRTIIIEECRALERRLVSLFSLAKPSLAVELMKIIIRRAEDSKQYWESEEALGSGDAGAIVEEKWGTDGKSESLKTESIEMVDISRILARRESAVIDLTYDGLDDDSQTSRQSDIYDDAGPPEGGNGTLLEDKDSQSKLRDSESIDSSTDSEPLVSASDLIRIVAASKAATAGQQQTMITPFPHDSDSPKSVAC